MTRGAVRICLLHDAEDGELVGVCFVESGMPEQRCGSVRCPPDDLPITVVAQEVYPSHQFPADSPN